MSKASLKVLIVDDDNLLREIYRQLLELDDYQVTEAENGLVALNILLNSSSTDLPDLIILDLMMPIMDGGTFLTIMRTTHKDRFQKIPVIIYSAFGELPASEYFSINLEKPVELSELLNAVTNLTKNSMRNELL
jgi:two-component system chemotaxis response regulator CheY